MSTTMETYIIHVDVGLKIELHLTFQHRGKIGVE